MLGSTPHRGRSTLVPPPLSLVKEKGTLLSAGNWNTSGSRSFPAMTVSLSQLLEDSFLIAWEYLERTGELGDRAIASRFLSDTIETHDPSRPAKQAHPVYRAIAAYQCFRLNGA